MNFNTVKLDQAVKDFKALFGTHKQMFEFGQFYVTNRTLADLRSLIEAEIRGNLRLQFATPAQLQGTVDFFKKQLSASPDQINLAGMLDVLDRLERDGDLAAIRELLKPTDEDKANAKRDFDALWTDATIPSAPRWSGSAPSLGKARAAKRLENDRCFQVLRSMSRKVLKARRNHRPAARGQLQHRRHRRRDPGPDDTGGARPRSTADADLHRAGPTRSRAGPHEGGTRRRRSRALRRPERRGAREQQVPPARAPCHGHRLRPDRRQGRLSVLGPRRRPLRHRVCALGPGVRPAARHGGPAVDRHRRRRPQGDRSPSDAADRIVQQRLRRPRRTTAAALLPGVLRPDAAHGGDREGAHEGSRAAQAHVAGRHALQRDCALRRARHRSHRGSRARSSQPPRATWTDSRRSSPATARPTS